METGQGSGQEAPSGWTLPLSFQPSRMTAEKGRSESQVNTYLFLIIKWAESGPQIGLLIIYQPEQFTRLTTGLLFFFNFLFHHNFRFTEQLQEQYKKSSHMSFTKMLTFYQSCFIIFLNIYTLFLPKPLQSKLQTQWPSSPKYFPRYSLNTGTFS